MWRFAEFPASVSDFVQTVFVLYSGLAGVNEQILLLLLTKVP